MSAARHRLARGLPALLPSLRSHSRPHPTHSSTPTGDPATSTAPRSPALSLAIAAAAAAAAFAIPTSARADVAASTPPFYNTSPTASHTPTAATAAEPTPTEPTPTPSYTSPSSHATLLRHVAEADLPAVQALSRIANHPENHLPLLRAGAVPALHAALSACGNNPDMAALRVNLLRVLADLAKSDHAPPFFLSAPIPTLLAATLRDCAPPAPASTAGLPWLLSLFGLHLGPAEPPPGPHPDQIPPADAVVDFLSMDFSGTTLSEVDLAAGIAYHAVRCVSSLARHSATHPDLLAAGLLAPLIHSLSRTDAAHPPDQQHAELVRCTILSVAALAKSAPEQVVNRGGHKPLIRFMAQDGDGVAQMYAAGGVRNLARHADDPAKSSWRVHRELVVAGVVDSLVAAMSPNSSPQTRVFAALAFGDLMTTEHHKADIIRRRLEPAFAPFAAFLREKNPAVIRAVFRTLSALFGDPEAGKGRPDAVIVVPPSLGKLLAEESGQVVNGAVARGDVAALKAVRAMCGDATVAQGMVDKGLLEVLVRGATKGKGEYWEQSVAALSLLSGWDHFRPLIVSRGALKAVLQRPCLEHDGRWSCVFFANMARSDEHHAEIAHSGLRVLLTALLSKDDIAQREGARALYNLSLGGVSRVMIGQGGALIPLVKTVSSSSGDARRYAIGALAKISEAYEHATKLIEADIISVLLQAASEDVKVAKDVALCLSHLSQFVEVHGSLARSGAAEWLVDMVSKNGGRGEHAADVMHYATLAICNIAYSPGITRTVLREHGAIRILTALSSSGMSAPHVVFSARQALHNLKGNEKPGTLPIEGTSKPALPA